MINYPYKSKKDIADIFGLSRATVQQRVGEIEASGRYGPYSTLRDGQILLVNTLVFIDWLKYRRSWNDQNLRKYVPEFNAEEVVRAMGMRVDRVALRKVKV